MIKFINMKYTCKHYLKFFIYFISSFIFVLLFSPTTSPLFPNYYGHDSAIFQTIGKGWANGYLPYVDLFDHKGPFIFFVNMVGYSIGGVYILQTVFLFFSILGIDDILSNFINSKKTRFIISFLFYIILIGYYTKGNKTEEYCLTFLIWSMSKQFKYFISKSFTHKPTYAFLYGITFGVCLMTRITNATILCSFILVILIDLILKKQWKNILHNFLAFVFGAALIVMPFVIYFNKHGALYDMIYGTLTYNFKFANSLLNINPMSYFDTHKLLRRIASLTMRYSIFVVMIVCSIIEYKNNRIYAFGIMISAILGFFVCVIIGYANYPYYAIIMVPCYFLIIYTITNSNVFITRKLLSIVYCLILIVFCMYSIFTYFKIDIPQQIYTGKSNLDFTNKVLNRIPNDEHNSIVGYNINPELYMNLDIIPECTYFICQDWHGEKSDELMNKIHNEFMSCDTKWILVKEGENGISDILEKSYIITNVYDVAGVNYYLYHLK